MQHHQLKSLFWLLNKIDYDHYVLSQGLGSRLYTYDIHQFGLRFLVLDQAFPLQTLLRQSAIAVLT